MARRPFQLNEALPSEQPSRNEALPSFYFSGSAGRSPARSASFLGCPRRPAVFPKAALPLKSFRACPTDPVDFQTEALPLYATAQPEALPSFLTSPLEALPLEQPSKNEVPQCGPAGEKDRSAFLFSNFTAGSASSRTIFSERSAPIWPGGGEGRSASTLKALAMISARAPGKRFPLCCFTCPPARSASVQLVAKPRPFLTEALSRGTLFGPGREAFSNQEPKRFALKAAEMAGRPFAFNEALSFPAEMKRFPREQPQNAAGPFLCFPSPKRFGLKSPSYDFSPGPGPTEALWRRQPYRKRSAPPFTPAHSSAFFLDRSAFN